MLGLTLNHFPEPSLSWYRSVGDFQGFDPGAGREA